MARNSKKAALYEVISKARAKHSSDNRLQQSSKDGTDRDQADTGVIEGLARWPKRPRVMQFNAGRLEVSMPYQLMIALFLGLVLLFLVVFRLGQNLNRQNQTEVIAEMPKKQLDQAALASLSVRKTDTPEKTEAAMKKAEPAKPGANNRIVIQTLDVRRDLEPVQRYYARFGINTDIRKINNVYYLVTSEKYKNPERAGTDGYIAKQKIVKVGVNYEPPSGYRSFGTKPFQDAYGMRFDD